MLIQNVTIVNFIEIAQIFFDRSTSTTPIEEMNYSRVTQKSRLYKIKCFVIKL